MVDLMSPYSRQCVIPYPFCAALLLLSLCRTQKTTTPLPGFASSMAWVWRAIGEQDVERILAGIQSSEASVVSPAASPWMHVYEVIGGA